MEPPMLLTGIYFGHQQNIDSVFQYLTMIFPSALCARVHSFFSMLVAFKVHLLNCVCAAVYYMCM
jgi:hypothetical protein